MAMSGQRYIVEPKVNGHPGILVGTGAPGTEVYPAGTLYIRLDAYGLSWSDGAGTWSAAGSVTDVELTAIGGLTSAADRLPYFTGLGTAALAVFTAFGRSLVAAVDAAAARIVLGLVPGTDVQAQDAGLTSLTAADGAAGLPYVTAANTWTSATLTAAGLALLDDADAAAQRATLGVKWWLSAEQTGTGADQTIAHSAGGFPSVLIIPTAGHDGAGAAGTQMPTTTFTSSDLTDIHVTVSAGAKFKLFAIG